MRVPVQTIDGRYYVEFEGVTFEVDPGAEIEPGDTYFAQRNTGLKLLTCLENVKHGTVPCTSRDGSTYMVGGWIRPTCNSYPYDTHECFKIIRMVEDEAEYDDLDLEHDARRAELDAQYEDNYIILADGREASA